MTKGKERWQQKMHRCSMLLLMGWVLLMGLANGQYVPLCAQQLIQCVDFMNSTNPPLTCCNPIKETQKTCFCQIASTPAILEALGATTAQALQLLHLCGVNFKITTCKASSSAPPPSLLQPSPMLGGDEGGDEGGAGRATFTGLSFALFLCACMLFNYQGGLHL